MIKRLKLFGLVNGKGGKAMSFKIDYKKTQMNAKQYLDCLSYLISTGCYKVRKVPVISIDDSTRLTDLLILKIPNKYDEEIVENLKTISKFSTEEKRLYYCAHLLGIKMRNLRSDCYTSEYTFGQAYNKYDHLVLKFALTREDLIAYCD